MTMLPFLLRRFGLAGLVTMGLLSLGCGKPAEPMCEAAVVVKVDGRPVEKGMILFYPSDGRAPAGGPFENGSLRFQAPAGECRVEILQLKLAPGFKDAKAADGSPLDPYVNILPAKYNSATTLRATPELGKLNEFTFELASK